jgi:death on curing protein
MTWVWISHETVMAIHEAQLAEHGGGVGVRDATLLESAMARPQNKAMYAEPNVCELAAAYGYGIARNHPFIDGNKRTAFVCVELFLRLNGHRLIAYDAACVYTMLAVAAGELEEIDFATWIKSNCNQL